MSTDDTFQYYRKLYAPRPGQPQSELTKAKAHWLALPEPERDEWTSFVLSAATLPQMRKWIFEKSGINLHKRDQMQRFRKWLVQQQLAVQRAKENKDAEERIQKEHSGWPLDRVREEVLKEAYASTRAKEDYKLGLQTVTAHCRTQSGQLDQRRYEDSKRSNEEKALAVCLQDAKKFPEVIELFKQAFAALRKAKAGK